MAKNNTLRYLLIGIPVLVAGFIVYRTIRRGKSGGDTTNADAPADSSKTTSNSSGGVTPQVSKVFPLKKGSKGSKVTELQNAILTVNKNLLPKFGADGDFGTETESAVNTLLKKKRIDSQDDIAKILTIAKNAEANVKLAQVNNERASLANKLVAAYKSNPSKFDFFAIHPVDILRGSVTSDGREFGQAKSTLTEGKPLLLRNARNISFDVNGSGFINAKYTSANGKGMFVYFSPYAFEVRENRY